MNMDSVDIRPAALKVARLCGLGGEAALPQSKAKTAASAKTITGKASAKPTRTVKATIPTFEVDTSSPSQLTGKHLLNKSHLEIMKITFCIGYGI